MKSKDLIIKELDNLPPKAHQLVREFIQLLRISLAKEEEKPGEKHQSVVKSKFIGMWKNREGTSDSVAFVKDLQKKHWGRKNA